MTCGSRSSCYQRKGWQFHLRNRGIAFAKFLFSYDELQFGMNRAKMSLAKSRPENKW